MSRNYWDICFTEKEVNELAELDRLFTKLKLWDWIKHVNIKNEDFYNDPLVRIIRNSLSYGSDAETLKKNIEIMCAILNNRWKTMVNNTLATKLFRQTEQYAHLNNLKEKHKPDDTLYKDIEFIIQLEIDLLREKISKTYVPPNYEI